MELVEGRGLGYGGRTGILALRKLERAAALARQVTDHDSDNPSSWRTLGSVQNCAGQWDAAAESLNRGIELSKGESAPTRATLPGDDPLAAR